MPRLILCLVSILLVPTWLSPVSAAPTPAQLCEANVELASASFTKCRLRAESIFSKSPDANRLSAALASCSDKLSQALAKADLKYGMVNCTAASAADYDAYLSQCTDGAAAAAVAGGTLPDCGNGLVDVAGEQCDGVDLGGETCASLGFVGGTLSCSGSCVLDTSACVTKTCGNGMREGAEQCDGGDLGSATCASLGFTKGGVLGCTSGCGFDTRGCSSQAFPATGQLTCLDYDGMITSCHGTGQDGDQRSGRALSFIDHGDGTVSDQNTGLMWEKKSADGSIHDYTRYFGWGGWAAVVSPTGEVLPFLNDRCDQSGIAPSAMTPCESDVECTGIGAERCGFGGHRDWRIPNIKEMQSIVDFSRTDPALDPIFFTPCTPGCVVSDCSCTWAVPGTASYYWTSTRNFARPTEAYNAGWVILAATGDTSNFYSSGAYFVRAVRGGS